MCNDCAKMRKDINSLHRAMKHILKAVEEIGDRVASLPQPRDGINWIYTIDWAKDALKEIENDAQAN
jgi:hypothetical protein